LRGFPHLVPEIPQRLFTASALEITMARPDARWAVLIVTQHRDYVLWGA
jgi:hypothetical protein